MFTRICPECQTILNHTLKSNRDSADKKKKLCASCSQKHVNRTGINNYFYGKKHNQKTLDKIKETKSKREYPIYQSEEFKEKISSVTKGCKNPMFGRKVYDIWVEKYGVEEADKRNKSWLQKLSSAASGENNSMYGKTSPRKAGNGWQGWYNKYFFRSLRELSYIINVLEKEGLEWKSAESIRIPYINYDGNNRTYSPDFLVDNKYLVEIKPIRLHNTPLIKLKTECAIKYCSENNLEFQIIDQKIMELKELELLVESEKIVLTEKTKEKLEKWKQDNQI